MPRKFETGSLFGVAVMGLFVVACTPTVRVEAPKDPIVINLNVKIEQEVRVKVEKEADQVITKRPDLF